jgi:hypothetical protein
VGASDKAWVQECARRLERTMEDALTRLEAERIGKHVPTHHEATRPPRLRRWLEDVIPSRP